MKLHTNQGYGFFKAHKPYPEMSQKAIRRRKKLTLEYLVTPHTSQELAEELGVHAGTANKYIQELVKKGKVIRTKGYKYVATAIYNNPPVYNPISAAPLTPTGIDDFLSRLEVLAKDYLWEENRNVKPFIDWIRKNEKA